jgi:hypothetical protein
MDVIKSQESRALYPKQVLVSHQEKTVPLTGLLSTHAEAPGSTEKVKRQPTLKSRPSSKDLSSRKKMHVPAREGTKLRHASMREN